MRRGGDGAAPTKSALALGFAGVVLVVSAQFVAGAEVRLSILYLVPIALVTWFFGHWQGLWVALSSTLAFFGTEVAFDRPYDPPALRSLNVSVHLAVYAAAALSLAGLKTMLRRRQELIGNLNEALAERKASQRELEAKARELAQSNAELEQYAHVVAHDLKSPLVAIGGYLQLLARRQGEGLEPDAAECVAHAMAGARRMEALIDDLLVYSTVGAGDASLEETDAGAALDRVLEDLGGTIEACGAVVTRDPLPVVRARKGQVDQLFQNLVANALKFRGNDAPRIHVSARHRDDEWVFAVRDNGIGIAPEHAEEIFGMFKRLPTGADVPGTGIGLAICRKIVEGHGGRIWVESVPGKGTTFFFALPVVAPARTPLP
ncbi:MAG: hypothetical protein HZB55_09505 [Deltaproteobacteria bacterium]|nr:hypothetical protein [Deltaproteobacteria bacterium]